MDKKIVLENVINACAEGNQAQFARRLGESPQTINAWLRRGTLDPIKIYKTFTFLNPHWLLTGEGEMLKDEAAEQSNVVRDDNARDREIELLRTQLEEKERTILILQQFIEELKKNNEKIRTN